MNRNIKSMIVALLVLALASFAVFAEGSGEKAGEFSAIDLGTASLETVRSSFQSSMEEYGRQYSAVREKMGKAYSNGDAETYFEAKGLLGNLDVPTITAEQTETLVSRILNETDAEARRDFAQWLYGSSRYYRPSMTFTLSVENESENSRFRFSDRYSISVKPGEPIVLPAMDAPEADAGVFAGWGITPDEVTYKAGEEIEFPYTDQVLYAVYKAGVRFVDSVTGVDVLEEGGTVSAPELTAPDDSYFFLGWYGPKGDKADSDDFASMDGSASYSARWLSMLVSDLGVKYYNDLNIPSGEQVRLSFSLTNQGNVNSGRLTIDLVPEDGSSLKVLTDTLSSRGIPAGQTRGGSFVLVAGGGSGDSVKAELVISDSDGHSWSAPVVLTIK